MLLVENSLLKFWDKTKKDFKRGQSFGDKVISWFKRKPKDEPTSQPTPEPKAEPKKNTDSKKPAKGKSKSVAKKYKEMKKQIKKRDCKPAPKAKGKIRCKKPGGGYVYFDKMKFKSSSK